MNRIAIDGKSRHPTLEVVFVLHVAPKIREVPAPFVPLKIKLPIRREDGNLLLDSDVISRATYPSPANAENTPVSVSSSMNLDG